MARINVHDAIVLCVIFIAGISGCAKKQKQADNPADRIRIAVAVDTAARRTLYQEHKFLGVLAAYREADLAPMAPGRVQSLPAKIGDFVRQGQIVAQMDDAQLVATIAGYQPIKSQYERSRSLYESNAISKSQFEAIEAQYTAMKRQVESLQENTVIKAPFSGVITSRAVEEGEVYSSMGGMPGQPKGLIRVTQLDPLKVDLDIDDQTVQYVKKGMAVTLKVDQVPDSLTPRGKVEYVNPQANSSSRTFGMRVVVPNARHTLKPGYFVEVHIVLDEKADVLSVPRGAVVDNRVFVVRDSIAYAKTVSLGWLTDSWAEILSGVDEHAVVVVKGNKALPDSARISIQQ
jgi:RND family efflux transporter MFP subunit